SLVGRLGQVPADQAAWDQFVDRYAPRIYGWCRHWGLPEADAEDVTQDVLLRLAQKMRDLRYDPSRRFRSWLKTLTRHAWSDFVPRRGKPGRGSGDSAALDGLNSVRARKDLLERLDEEFDRELLDEATTRVRLRVEPRTWDAFRLMALEGRPAAEAAA